MKSVLIWDEKKHVASSYIYPIVAIVIDCLPHVYSTPSIRYLQVCEYKKWPFNSSADYDECNEQVCGRHGKSCWEWLVFHPLIFTLSSLSVCRRSYQTLLFRRVWGGHQFLVNLSSFLLLHSWNNLTFHQVRILRKKVLVSNWLCHVKAIQLIKWSKWLLQIILVVFFSILVHVH